MAALSQNWAATLCEVRNLALDALDQALYERRVESTQRLGQHSDRGMQYLSTRYSERMAEAGIESSVGHVGNSYDNTLAETIIGLYKSEVIRQHGPWRHLEAVELATLEWVEWFNRLRLYGPISDLTPVEKEEFYFQNQEWVEMA